MAAERSIHVHPSERSTPCLADCRSVCIRVQSQAMVILKEQAGALDVVATLKLIPESTQMHLLTPWLTQALQNGIHQSRHLAVTTKLYQMENLRVKANNAMLTQRGAGAGARVTKKKRPSQAAGGGSRPGGRGSERERAAATADDEDEDEPAGQQQEEDDGEQEEEMAGSLPRESTNDGDLMSGW